MSAKYSRQNLEVLKMKIIDIIKYEYGLNTKQAKEYLKNVSQETLKNLEQGFVNNARKSFYED